NHQLDSLVAPNHSNPGHTASKYVYDALGNLTRITTPRGMITDLFSDYIGRDSVIYTPTDASNSLLHRAMQAFVYDTLDLVKRVTSVGESVTYAVESVGGTA